MLISYKYRVYPDATVETHACMPLSHLPVALQHTPRRMRHNAGEQVHADDVRNAGADRHRSSRMRRNRLLFLTENFCLFIRFKNAPVECILDPEVPLLPQPVHLLGK